MHIMDLTQSIAALQKTVVDIGENERRRINSKDITIEGLSKEVDKIIVDAKKQNDKIIEMNEDQKKKDTETLQTIQNELKNKLEAFNIPPLNNVMGQEEKLQNKLKVKESLIDHLKSKFEEKCKE